MHSQDRAGKRRYLSPRDGILLSIASGRQRFPVPTQEVEVNTIRLDDYLRSLRLEKVDLIKIDTEGAELEILQGAENLLLTESSPVIMIEISDERTRPWGYSSAAIYDFLARRGYAWFSVTDDG